MGDFEAIIFMLFFFFIIIIIIPVVILVNISSLKKEIRELNRKVSKLATSEKTGVLTASVTKPEEVIEEQPFMPTPPPIPDEKTIAELNREIYSPLYEQEPVHEFDIEEPLFVPVQNQEVMEEDENEKPAVPVYSMPSVPDLAQPSIPEPVESLHTVAADIPPIPVEEGDDSRNFFERILGANWLSKIGIVTLVLGIAFFVKYAIDQNWINEIGRVGIGLLTGGIIIGIAHKLKAKYHVFSSILVGGGISVFYITITLAFREYELFSQNVAFILLIIITVFSVLLSLLYDRKELAVFSLLGGFASPLMVSTGTGNYMVLFSYIFILNMGMLVVSYVKQWRLIGIISYILTLLFFWVWTFSSYKNEYFTVALFISLFFVQFYLLALFDHFKSDKKISAYQVFMILTNNLSAFFAYIYVFEKYSSDIRGLITISLAVVNAIVLITLFRNSRIDKNLVYLLIAIVMSFVSLAIPIQLRGHVITLFWAAESVVLLWLWQKSQIRVFHIGFILISLLTLFSYLMDVNNNYSYYDSFEIFANRLFITGIVVVACYAVNLVLLIRDKENLSGNLPVIQSFKLIIITLLYAVLFIEFNYQLKEYTDIGLYGVSSFRSTALATFTIIYIAALAFIYHKQVLTKQYIFTLLYFSVFLYAIVYSVLIIDLRGDIFNSFYDITYSSSLFSIHLLSLPAIGYIIYLLVLNIKAFHPNNTVLSWMLTVLVVIILSVETDNVVIGLWGNRSNYESLLYDIHTFGYPILWGVIAMVLMVWGLNRKEALLRKISLVFFALIIVKFYAYDVWKMSQTGRIVSFVLLGVILLVVSFLQQKIRTLVKDESDKVARKTDEINEPNE